MKEWIKRIVVLAILILYATLVRMLSEKAGTQTDPWAILEKVAMIAGTTSIVYGIAFWMADLMFDGRRK